MPRYLVGRVFQGFATLWLVSLVVFGLARTTGDPALLMLPFTASAEDVAAMRQRLGTDRPIVLQYASFVADTLGGNLGVSTRLRVPVGDLLKQYLPSSLALAGLAITLAVVLALGLGLLAAAQRGGPGDSLVRVAATLGLSLPPFWVGIVAIEVFALRLRLLPTSGADSPLHIVLPGVTLSLFVMGGMVRLLRSSLTEAVTSQYAQVAAAKGLSAGLDLRRHALPNALLPLVGFAGAYFPLLVSSAVVVETVFAWPGIGRLAFQAIVARDFPVVQGVTLLGSAIVVLTSLIVDVLYSAIDPRVRYA